MCAHCAHPLIDDSDIDWRQSSVAQHSTISILIIDALSPFKMDQQIFIAVSNSCHFCSLFLLKRLFYAFMTLNPGLNSSIEWTSLQCTHNLNKFELFNLWCSRDMVRSGQFVLLLTTNHYTYKNVFKLASVWRSQPTLRQMRAFILN